MLCKKIKILFDVNFRNFLINFLWEFAVCVVGILINFFLYGQVYGAYLSICRSFLMLIWKIFIKKYTLFTFMSSKIFDNI